MTTLENYYQKCFHVKYATKKLQNESYTRYKCSEYIISTIQFFSEKAKKLAISFKNSKLLYFLIRFILYLQTCLHFVVLIDNLEKVFRQHKP